MKSFQEHIEQRNSKSSSRKSLSHNDDDDGSTNDRSTQDMVQNTTVVGGAYLIDPVGCGARFAACSTNESEKGLYQAGSNRMQ